MNNRAYHRDLLASALTTDSLHSLEEVHHWLELRRQETTVSITQIPLKKLRNWSVTRSGEIRHQSGHFFSIEGIRVTTNWGFVNHWEQPILNQPEIGILGFIAKRINGVLHFLAQAKIEPGNINVVQVGPTLQATKSNLKRVHGGKTPPYTEYFEDVEGAQVILDQLQSEQGARFLKKRNRNMIVEVTDEIEVAPDYMWLTLKQLKELMKSPNIINMDARTIISCIDFGSFSLTTWQLLHSLQPAFMLPEFGMKLLHSSILRNRSYHTIGEIISWLTKLKMNCELEIEKIPLKKVSRWQTTADCIEHEDKKYFKVIAANVTITNREVSSWDQPLIQAAQEGITAFIVKEIDDVLHFLVQAKLEPGNFDLIELAPTVQCITDNYRTSKPDEKQPFLDYVLKAKKKQIKYSVMQSEEGGRFYQEQNKNMLLVADESFPLELPPHYIWMTLNQIHSFMTYNNYFNVEARSIISALRFDSK